MFFATFHRHKTEIWNVPQKNRTWCFPQNTYVFFFSPYAKMNLRVQQYAGELWSLVIITHVSVNKIKHIWPTSQVFYFGQIIGEDIEIFGFKNQQLFNRKYFFFCLYVVLYLMNIFEFVFVVRCAWFEQREFAFSSAAYCWTPTF